MGTKKLYQSINQILILLQEKAMHTWCVPKKCSIFLVLVIRGPWLVAKCILELTTYFCSILFRPFAVLVMLASCRGVCMVQVEMLWVIVASYEAVQCATYELLCPKWGLVYTIGCHKLYTTEETVSHIQCLYHQNTGTQAKKCTPGDCKHWYTWRGIAGISGSQGGLLPHGNGEVDYEAKQKLSGVKAAVVGIATTLCQCELLLNCHDHTELVYKHHYTVL